MGNISTRFSPSSSGCTADPNTMELASDWPCVGALWIAMAARSRRRANRVKAPRSSWRCRFARTTKRRLMSNNSNPVVILMAEDDADDRLLAKDALSECGLAGDLHFVENGEELLDYLHRRGKYKGQSSHPRPGLILLDLNMPRKDGREALREIKTNPELRRIPIVVLTTSQADTDIGAIYELGANSFISKPFQFEALVAVMRVIGQYWFKTVQLPVCK